VIKAFRAKQVESIIERYDSNIDSRAETYSVESRIKASLKQYKIKGTQSQTELYSLSLAEAETLVSQLLGPSAI